MEIQLNFKHRLFLGIVTLPFLIAWMTLIFSLIYSYYLYTKISNVGYEDLLKYKSLDKEADRVGFMIRDDASLNLLLADSYAGKGGLRIEEMDEGMKNRVKEELLNVKEDPARRLKSYSNPAKDFLGAIKFYQRAIINSPLSGESHLKLGILYANLKINDKACREFEKASLLDPTNAYHQFDVGRYFLSIGEYEKGFESLKKANGLRFQSLPETLDLVWNERKSYQDLIKITPESSAALLTLGEFLLKKGIWEEAVTVYKKAISIDPKNSLLYKFLSQAYEMRKMWDEAIKLLEDGIKKNPENPDIYFYLGIIYFKKSDFEEAIYNIKKAIKLYKDRFDTRPLIEYHRLLANIYYNHTKDFKKALEEAEIVLRLNPLEGWAYFLRGLCYKSMDSDPAEMINSFKKAVAYNPDELQYRITLAGNLYIYGLYREALAEWEGIKRFKSQEKIAEEKIKEINNTMKEEQKKLFKKRN